MASPAPPPPRRFKIEAVETTSVSSKRLRKPEPEPPQPVESSEPAHKPIRKFLPEPVETSTKSSRKFLPEPVETSTKSSRKFLPEPVETSTKSHRRGQDEVQKTTHTNGELEEPHRATKTRFSPLPIETTTRKHRHVPEQMDDDDDDEIPLLPHERAVSSLHATDKPVVRKFAPQLIETAKRSRKSGDTAPALLPQDKTNASPGDHLKTLKPQRPGPSPYPPVPDNTPHNSSYAVPQIPKPAPIRQPSIRAHYNTRANTREHCFKVPTLDTVESSESEPSEPHSLQNSPTLDATRIRESIDDRFSGYLLSLAARTAEQQLREQAAAAFPNDDYHEPVNHYMDRDDGSDEEEEDYKNDFQDKTRRDSSDDALALEEMQKYGERLQVKKRTAAFNVEFDAHPGEGNAWITATGPYAAPANAARPRKVIGGDQKDPELLRQRKAASPPMLGGDIVFPRCESPTRARFDVTQAPDASRNSMCYLTSQAGCTSPGGLWGERIHTPMTELNPTWGDQTDGAKGTCGLWGGLCTGSDSRTSTGPSGLVTPRRTPTKEKDNPFERVGLTITGKRPLPPSPPASVGCETSLTEAQSAALEAHLDTEFDDAFVTQVYNYLSLGYPALATKFDEELSKISRVPVVELQKDDKLAEARGYVRLGDEDEPGTIDGIEEDTCVRWKALRLYIREWGRQQPGMGSGAGVDAHHGWGLPARKGSWAI